MLKMPALRGELQLLSTRRKEVLGLCGAFEEASSTLDRLRKEGQEKNREIIAEYEALCAEIEQEIIFMCLDGGDQE
ncbi:hypothetical protein [Borborobacter arsenicus]|nr:hypothetical protein [Pseudaminobacter arsenicus]